MKRILIILLLASTFLNEALACFNITKYAKDHILLYEDLSDVIPYGHNFQSVSSYKKGIKKLDSLYKRTNNLDYLSDKGLLLILLKEYQQAIDLYLEIEKIQPGRYSTASNIGTTYELVGKNEEALKWIKKSMEINPEAHEKSEWIHVKILEAKIKGESNITSQFLLNTDFGDGVFPKTNLERGELEKLYMSLFYQLNERVSFVKPKDKIVALLLFDLGNMGFLLQNHTCKSNYHLAKGYGFSGQLIKRRTLKYDSLMNAPIPEILMQEKDSQKIQDIKSQEVKQLPAANSQESSNDYQMYWLIGSGVLILLIGVIIYRRKRNEKVLMNKL